jgi:hypothetical protein
MMGAVRTEVRCWCGIVGVGSSLPPGAGRGDVWSGCCCSWCNCSLLLRARRADGLLVSCVYMNVDARGSVGAFSSAPSIPTRRPDEWMRDAGEGE